MTTPSELSGTPEPVRIYPTEDWFKITARHRNGKAHRAYATADGRIIQMSCSCPGSANGSLRNRCYPIANGWGKSNCQN